MFDWEQNTLLKKKFFKVLTFLNPLKVKKSEKINRTII